MAVEPTLSHGTQDAMLARRIIAHLGQSGTPPEEGLEWYTVGLDEYLHILQDEYLEFLIPDGISSFKLVIGSYGGGKTHFLYVLRNLAEKLDYAVSYVPLSPVECPFNQMGAVYRALVNGLQYPGHGSDNIQRTISHRGIEAFIRFVYHKIDKELQLYEMNTEQGRQRLALYLEQFTGIESTSFRRAIETALIAQFEGNESLFQNAIQWLKGEGVQTDSLRKNQIVEAIDHRSAFRMIRSLIQWIRQAGLKGTVILFDEAERAISLNTTRQVMGALDHLRQWIDECGQARFPSVLTVYAVPDETMLTDRPGPSYEALRQRLHTVFSRWEPTGVKIYLERLQMEPEEFLNSLGRRLTAIYERAYNIVFPPELVARNLGVLANRIYQMRYADISYRRLFITTVIPLLHQMRNDFSFLLTDEIVEQWVLQRLMSAEQDIVDKSNRHEF